MDRKKPHIYEFHLHLYGCFTAQDLYEQGQLLGEFPRWEWFASEYEAAWGKFPTWYWDKKNGLEILTSEVTLTQPASFAQFQSAFNLSIALFPAVPEDQTPARIALERIRAQGVYYAELRMVIPFYFSHAQAQIFLRTLAGAFSSACTENFQPRLVISLPQGPPSALEQQYSWVREAMAQDSTVAAMLVALDFCGDEEPHPPLEKQDFFQRAHADNLKSGQPLRFYYHVGECFSKIGMQNAIRRIWQTHRLGVDRLSHASALAIPPASYLGHSIQETVQERLSHIEFLLESADWLRESGCVYSLDELRKEQETLGEKDPAEILARVISAHEVEQTHALQQAVVARLRAEEAVIESCPSSNWILSGISRLEDHPLPALLRSGLCVVMSSDDPGIFQTDYEKEEAFCREKLGMSEEELQRLRENGDFIFHVITNG